MAGLTYAWALNRDPLEPYYAAAVRSMSSSWHNFVFGSFDPAGTITLDKLSGAFWVQALAVRAFGFHPWVIVAPQAVEGVLTVLVLYRAVSRLAGPVAGLIAAAVLAVSPATVALNRGNISDSLMILLLVLAADAVSGALDRGSQGRLLLAGLWVGLAFQAKMIEAWIVLPAFALTYLLAANAPLARRIGQVLVAGVLTGAVSLAWMAAVSLVPAAHRPYLDGSHNDSFYQQVFVYNGFGRLGDHTPLQLLAGQRLGVGPVAAPPPAGPARRLRGDLGRDTGWLLPAAFIAALWGIASRGRRPRGDPIRACFVLWGSWLLLLAVTFSVATTINAYYTAALTPAVAALLGAGAATVWSARGGAAVRLGMAAVLAGTTGYAAWLLGAAPGRVPGWLVPVVFAAGLAGVVTIAGSVAIRGATALTAALAAGLLCAVLAPAVASALLVMHHEGAFDTPFEPARVRNLIDVAFVGNPARAAQTISQLESFSAAPDLLATQTAALAAEFIEASGREVLPIGGFTGTIPAPTLAQLQADIRRGQFHLVLATTLTDPRIRWIAAHCQPIGPPGRPLHQYFCVPADAG